VKAAFFESAESQPRAQTTRSTLGPQSTPDDAGAKLRQLAQLLDTGLINEADFEAKKDEQLLSRMQLAIRRSGTFGLCPIDKTNKGFGPAAPHPRRGLSHGRRPSLTAYVVSMLPLVFSRTASR
jgi:hypothetical protein